MYGHGAVDGECSLNECGMNQEACRCFSKEEAQGEHSSRRWLQIGSAGVMIGASTIVTVAYSVCTHYRTKKGEHTRVPYAICVGFVTMLCFMGGLAWLFLGIFADFSNYVACGQHGERGIFV